MMIRNKQYPFPTMSNATETGQNLSNLKLTLVNILSVSETVPADTLRRNIGFLMTDATSDNVEVENMVAEDLGSTYTPAHLLWLLTRRQEQGGGVPRFHRSAESPAKRLKVERFSSLVYTCLSQTGWTYMLSSS